jgi:hypothetical protein
MLFVAVHESGYGTTQRFAAVQQSSDLGQRNDLADSRSVYWPGVRTILAAQEPVCAEEPKPTRALPPQDGHLMPKRDSLKFQGRAATKSE